MQNICHFWDTIYTTNAIPLLKAAIIIVSGFILARFASSASLKLLNRYASAQQSMLFQKIIYFSILALFLVAALQQLGFKLSVLLGSAGIATAAIAFASQTSISNMISGIFLILEKSIQVGDSIKVGNTQGTVLSVDLLSVKVLTAKNTLIRIPNETLIKTDITNLSRFKSRRLDLSISVSVEENVDIVKQHLLDIATRSPLILASPSPCVLIKDIDSHEVQLQLSVWSEQQNFDTIADNIYSQILNSFKLNDIQFNEVTK